MVLVYGTMPNETEHEKKTPLYLLKAWLFLVADRGLFQCFYARFISRIGTSRGESRKIEEASYNGGRGGDSFLCADSSKNSARVLCLDTLISAALLHQHSHSPNSRCPSASRGQGPPYKNVPLPDDTNALRLLSENSCGKSIGSS